MCNLDIYSKKSFDIHEDTLIHIHAAEPMSLFFCCIAWFLGKQINILTQFFLLPDVKPPGTEVGVA